MRLDELLIARNLASEAEVREALDYQRARGGRLESHLFRFGYVSEAAIVSALAEQFGCRPICLSGLTLPNDVIRIVPAELARSRLILPFAYDQSQRILKIACENPRRSSLDEDLKAALPDIQTELYIALADVLRAALAVHYREVPASIDPAFDELPAAPSTVSVPIEQLVSFSSKCRILIYEEKGLGIPALRPVLQHQGFLISECTSIDDLHSAFHSTRPDVFLLVIPGGPERISELLAQLDSRAVSVATCPSYLVAQNVDHARIGELLKIGFEDVIRAENVLDLLIIKLNRFKERLITQRNQRVEILQTLGTHGSLSDINVIDLLQAMGPTGKTAQICISAAGQQLSVFLDRGRIIFAECDDNRGVEALYSAIGWDQGVWSVDPISPDQLPAPNVFSINEAILLEGCRRLDELNRADLPSPQPSGDPLAAFDHLN